MFSVRVFFSVAGVLLISNAAKTNAVGRLDCKGKDADYCLQIYVQVAEEETEKAQKLLTGIHLENLDKANVALSDAKLDFEKLQKGVEEPMQDLKNALTLLVGAYETVEGNCKNDDRCKTVLTHIGKSAGFTVTAIKNAVADDGQKQEIDDLYEAYFRKQDLTDEEKAENLYLFAGEVLSVLSEDN